MPNALFSLTAHDGLESLAQKLIDRGFRLFATTETLAFLRSCKIAVSSLPIQIRPGDYRSMELLRTEVLDSVLVGEQWIPQPKFDLVCADITGIGALPNKVLLMAAVEGDRIPLLSVHACEAFLDVWDYADDETFEKECRSLAFRTHLALARSSLAAAAATSDVELFHLIGTKVSQPAYGENPHQESHGFYALIRNGAEHDPLAIPRFTVVRGSSLSHNNYLDLSRAVDTMSRIASVYAHNELPIHYIAVGVKHGSVCGAAHHVAHPHDAVRAMIEGQPRDIFGGVVIVNFEIDVECAQLLLTHATENGRVLDVVIAPSITLDARQVLARKNEKCRMLVNESLRTMHTTSIEQGSVCTMVRGGVLVQESPRFLPHLDAPQLEYDGAWTAEARADMVLAWAIGATSLSNSITLVKDGMLVGNGVAATSRVEACHMAVSRAGERARGAVAYSDSFFPFTDGVDVLADHGVQYVFATDGSRMDAHVKRKMRDRKLNSCFVADSVGRGFRH
jgi:phosphoribosylaminoimidazolecarboxamide formyltransferase/IMP cyclohydrolase